MHDDPKVRFEPRGVAALQLFALATRQFLRQLRWACGLRDRRLV